MKAMRLDCMLRGVALLKTLQDEQGIDLTDEDAGFLLDRDTYAAAEFAALILDRKSGHPIRDEEGFLAAVRAAFRQQFGEDHVKILTWNPGEPNKRVLTNRLPALARKCNDDINPNPWVEGSPPGSRWQTLNVR